MNETVNLVFITDNGYCMPTLVALSSIYENKQKGRNYSVFVFNYQLNEENQLKLKKLAKKEFEITLVTLEEDCQYTKISNQTHVPYAALYKFNIPLILSNLDKALYLDSDILVQQGLETLYDRELPNNYACMVKDTAFRNDPAYWERISFQGKHYCNSGVMLLNLKKMREDDIPKKLLDCRLRTHGFYMDQDTFNIVLQDRIQYLSSKFNRVTLFLEKTPIKELEEFYGEKLENNIADNYKKAVILHIAGARKPWNSFMGYLSYSFIKYAFKVSISLGIFMVLRTIRAFFVSKRIDGLHTVVSFLGLNIRFRRKVHPKYLKPNEYFFSIAEEDTHKVIRVLGLKFKVGKKVS